MSMRFFSAYSGEALDQPNALEPRVRVVKVCWGQAHLVARIHVDSFPEAMVEPIILHVVGLRDDGWCAVSASH